MSPFITANASLNASTDLILTNLIRGLTRVMRCGAAAAAGTIYRLNVANPNAAPVVVATGVRNSVGLEHHPDTKVRCCCIGALLNQQHHSQLCCMLCWQSAAAAMVQDSEQAQP